MRWFRDGQLVSEGDSITEGIGQGRVTANLDGFAPDPQLIFEIDDAESLRCAYGLLREEGLALGLSSGTNVAGATAVARKTWQWVGARNEAEARACVLSRLRRRVGLVVVREMARHRLRRVPYIGVPRHIVEERMQPFHLRAIERGGGAAVSAADFYAFQQRQGAWGRDAA